jgi:hypothetical protein
MGLLKMFGVGGGSLDVVLHHPQIPAGGNLSGVARFIAGKRAQTIDALYLSVTCTTYRMEQTPQGPQRRSESQTLVPRTAIANGVTVAPGDTVEYPFSFYIPPGSYNSEPGKVEYRLSGSADIDGEVDPGDSEIFTVIGGSMYYATQTITGPAVGQRKIGDRVFAVWTDGRWYPGKVTNMSDGWVGVDWDDPNLGATAWVAADKVKNEAEYRGQQQAQQAQAAHFHAQPVAAPPQPQPMKGAPQFKVGQLVTAEHPKFGWQSGKVVQFQDVWIGIDWEGDKLGESSWLQSHQIKPR